MDFNTHDPFTVEFAESGTRTTPVSATVREARAVPGQSSPSPRIVGTSAAPKSIVDTWGAITRAGMTAEMYAKLVRLASLPPGWRGPGARALRASSLAQFLHFWSLVRPNATEPELALAPDGSVHAEWFKSPRQRLDVRFAENNVRFGMFVNHNILEGADKLVTVANILKSHHAKPLTWRAT
jgi:hypothetical protein